MYSKDTDFWLAAVQIAQQSRLEAALASAFRQQKTGSGITMRGHLKASRRLRVSGEICRSEKYS
ncbi:MAG: hypothetical protein VX768_00935 [Planctomycetota bacterium]|nr:hypothetical protein [Planctomycetota bacterium]